MTKTTGNAEQHRHSPESEAGHERKRGRHAAESRSRNRCRVDEPARQQAVDRTGRELAGQWPCSRRPACRDARTRDDQRPENPAPPRHQPRSAAGSEDQEQQSGRNRYRTSEPAVRQRAAGRACRKRQQEIHEHAAGVVREYRRNLARRAIDPAATLRTERPAHHRAVRAARKTQQSPAASVLTRPPSVLRGYRGRCRHRAAPFAIIQPASGGVNGTK